MKTYKSNLPEITLRLKKGEFLKVKITSSEDIYNVFKQIWDKETIEIYESMICIYLNRANNTLGWMKISQGGLTGTLIDNKLILSAAITSLASGIIIAHNHPSGNTQPSDSDKLITKKLKDAAIFMDITVLDHLIVSEDSYYSFADNGML